MAATSDAIDVSSFTAVVFGGSVNGSAKVRLDTGQSSLKAEFRGIDVDKSIGAASPDAPKLSGSANGSIDLTWPGMRMQNATGTVVATIKGTIPSDTGGHPVDGDIALTAVPGRLRIDKANFASGDSHITAVGEIGWDRTADVTVTADAAKGEDLIALATAASPAVGEMLAQRKVAIDGPFHFDGRITGTLATPSIDGRVQIARVVVNGEELGSFSAAVVRESAGVTLRDARVDRSDGASIAFNLSLPTTPGAGQVVDATITRYPIVSLFNLSPIGASEDLKAFGGMVSGHAKLTIPGEGKILDGIIGSLDLNVDGATLKAQPLEKLRVGVRFGERTIEMPVFELATTRGQLTGHGTYEKTSRNYTAAFDVTNIDLKLLESMATSGDKPSPVTASGTVTGRIELAGRNAPDGNVLTRLDGSFAGNDVIVEREQIGSPTLTVSTAPDATGAAVATVKLAGAIRGQRREIVGQIFVAEEDQPFKVALAFDGFDALGLAGTPPEGVTSRVTGNVSVEGFLADLSAENGIRERLRIDGRFSELSLVADVDTNGRQYTIANKGDVVFGVADNALRFEKATFSGDSTEVTLSGDLALAAPAVSNLTVSGDVNLELISTLARNVYATGSANIQASVGGPPGDPRFTGFADLKDIGLRAVDVPVAITNGAGRVVFTSNQALIESMTAQANGGRVVVDGGVLFEGLKPARWRFGIDAKQVRMTYPQDVRSILDGDLTLQGNRQLQVLSGTVNLRRAEFTRDIDANDMLALDSRRSQSAIGTGASTARSLIRLDLNVEARDSIIIRNNLADIAASASLVLTGAIDDPVIDGRATITRGTLDFRDNEYQINRGVVRFPGRLGGEITFDMQAESDIKGYRVTVGIAGTPTKTYPVLRSEPALTEPQIVSLILTGDIGSGEVSTQNLGQQGVNLASALLTEALSRSVEKRTGELFGINRFQIDPLVGGRNPSARVTIGRQVNKNLSILYSTNISSGEDQVIQLEYKLSNRFSLVASRDENGAYGLDIRVRKRF
ncbi:MAG TPA: translocation/assembly module TamB domain-containing protein [Blastocatellia bacterium]|nr:translocation/assembly module TamB domain-containing protein [Blastocatellia bacterium]